MTIDRRNLLTLLGLGVAGQAAAQTSPQPAGAPAFRHGVASGDPSHDRVILWTRVSGATTDVPLEWEMSKTPDFKKLAASGFVRASADRDFTAKVDATGLKHGTEYFYRFKMMDVGGYSVSAVGRTRTLPSGPLEGLVKDVVLAFATCSLYPNGYFNAYGAIAALPRVDAVVHLGDYIYEYGGPSSYGMDSAVAKERPHDPPHDCVSLDDYRRRHAQYKTDPQLQAAHARAPWIVVWDDHETANDSWTGGAENHKPATEGDWNLRKAAAIKAYYEWMPIREPTGGGFAINRSFDFGDIASLFMLETRLTARDQQLTYQHDLPRNPTKADVAAFRVKLDDPRRRMMSAGQESWLKDGLETSVGTGKMWQILGNEVVMARLAPPPIRGLMGDEAFAQATAKLSKSTLDSIKGLEQVSALGLPYGLDMWDGYPADRQRLYGLLSDARANAIVVSGDSHAFWANELYAEPDGGGDRIAVEFGSTGITSPGAGDVLTTIPVGQLFAKHNKEVRFSDQSAKGFILLTLTRHEARAQLIAVSTIVDAKYTTAVLKGFKVEPGPLGVSELMDL